ncbi:hypothetical protein BJ546DRAFT_1026972 [Cryomyces antarcticus]
MDRKHVTIMPSSISQLKSFRKQKLLTEYAGLKYACPHGVYATITPGDPALWAGVLFVREGPYAPAILRFRLQFPSLYPSLPPIITFTTDIFHPLVTPLTTHTYSTGGGDVETVSANDEGGLPPGGFSLRHGFPDWEDRVKKEGASMTGASLSDSSVTSHAQKTQSRSELQDRSQDVMRSPKIMQQPDSAPGREIHIVEVLRYMRSTFDNEVVLDSVPLEAAGNSGAWHAWRSHRARVPESLASAALVLASKESSIDDGSSGANTPARQQLGGARGAAHWNWEGVWEERVKKGISSSISEPVLYGHASGSDDLIRFAAMDSEMLEKIAKWNRSE